MIQKSEGKRNRRLEGRARYYIEESEEKSEVELEVKLEEEF